MDDLLSIKYVSLILYDIHSPSLSFLSYRTPSSQSNDTLTNTTFKSATPTPPQPRPLIRPRVYARPVLPGIKVIVGGGNRPIVSRPPGPPQLRPSITPRTGTTNVSSVS